MKQWSHGVLHFEQLKQAIVLSMCWFGERYPLVTEDKYPENQSSKKLDPSFIEVNGVGLT